jgi:hypothetical protein
MFAVSKNKIMSRVFFYCMFGMLMLPMLYCQTNGKTGKKKSKRTVQTSTVKGNATVSFASYGSGIDAERYGKLKEFLDKEGLKFTEKPMGREGEVDISIDFTNRSDNEKKRISDFLKSLHHPESLVRVEVK